jgi:UDP-N-acetylmuramoylalanine--D-glutamate ligase
VDSFLKGKKVAVVGMARSGIGAARLIHRLGGHALVSDIKPATELSQVITELHSLGIETETGSHARLASGSFDFVVLSPGVVPNRELLSAWDVRSIPIWSELELAARVCEVPWIGVTGSNGKTTTVNLIADILRVAGKKVIMAGNVGQAWSGFLPADHETVFAIEVSSFQLEHAPTVKPHVGVVLNLYENHLDRHASMQEYAELKSRLLSNQNERDFAVLNADDKLVSCMADSIKSKAVWFGSNGTCNFWLEDDKLMTKSNGKVAVLLKSAELPLIGVHNRMNALAAAAAAYSFGIKLEPIRNSLQQAKAVEHRIEFVAVKDGVTYVNDSKSTNMTATLTALDAFPKNVILLFGGRPKKESFTSLAKRFPCPVKAMIYFGEAREKIRAELAADLPMEETDDLHEALLRARSIARSGDTVLLSPGCASFDQFTNFEERGRIYKSYVSEL